MALDIGISAVLAICTIIMAYLGVHVTIHPPNESVAKQRLFKRGFWALGIMAVALVVWQGIRNGTAQQTAAARIESLGSEIRSTQSRLEAESYRRERAERDLQISIQSTGKATREGVAADIKKSPIKVEVNGVQSGPVALQVEDIRLLSEAERSTHPDAPYAVKVTLQASAPIDPIRLAIKCSSPPKYVEMGPREDGSFSMIQGGTIIYKDDPTYVVMAMKSLSGPVLKPESSLVLHISAVAPIRVVRLERGPR